MTKSTSSKYLVRAALKAAILAELGAQSVVGFGLTTATLRSSQAGLPPRARDGALSSKVPQGPFNAGPVCSEKLGRWISRQIITCEAATSREHGSSSTASKDTQDEQGSDQPGGEQNRDAVAFSTRVAAVDRAIESRLEDRLFNDPYAERLAGSLAMELFAGEKGSAEGADGGSSNTSIDTESGKAYLMDERVLGLLRRVQDSRLNSIRIRYCDDYFEDCTVSRGIKQVVALAAGMDTRGLRLKAQEGTKVFEVEQGLVLRLKRDLLSEPGLDVQAREDGTGRATVIGVEATLGVDDLKEKLVNGGFDPSLPSAWIMDGVTPYLEEDALKGLLNIVGDLCAPGSALCMTFADKDIIFKGLSLGDEIMSAWKLDSPDPEGLVRGQFSNNWSFKSAWCNTPGGYPDGGHYGIECSMPAETFVIGFS